ncbi:hypothetical protein [Vagococcus zengguangii]|uniref:Uncharacterized protein n=1 Tax=Vagococcus zengguangii TaxID=2571750 RepID=A0A4D7D0G4_9ENTE|nr:hypothetical protein [Vagococcus zengguangii]QCI87206.1 hypothetical protein FA707_09815 [Vagococcus zengguangii]TLG80710.1 hypothetical protein FE258_04430 [Vagococcus zengguangii]
MLIEVVEIVLIFLITTYSAIFLSLGLWVIQMKQVSTKLSNQPEKLEAYFENLTQRKVFLRSMANYLFIMLVFSILLAMTFWREKPIYAVFLFGWGLFHLAYKYWQKKDQFHIMIQKKTKNK